MSFIIFRVIIEASLFLMGLFMLVMGFFYIFASKDKISKVVRWYYSFSPIKPKKDLQGRPLKIIRMNGMFSAFFGLVILGLVASGILFK